MGEKITMNQQSMATPMNKYMEMGMDELVKEQESVLTKMRELELEPVAYETVTSDDLRVIASAVEGTPWTIASLRANIDLISELHTSADAYDKSEGEDKKVKLGVLWCMMLITSINKLSGLSINDKAVALNDTLMRISDELMSVNTNIVVPKMQVINELKDDLSLILDEIEKKKAI